MKLDWHIGRNDALFHARIYREPHLEPRRVVTLDLTVLRVHLMVSLWLPGGGKGAST